LQLRARDPRRRREREGQAQHPRNLQFGADIWLSSTTTATASSFYDNTIRDNGYGVYVTAQVGGGGLPPVSQLPYGHRNNIFDNGGTTPDQQQLIGGNPNSTGVDWSNNYWGATVFWRPNPEVCPDAGYLAYPNATPTEPKSPASRNLYVAGPFPGSPCTKNWYYLGGPAGFSPFPFGLEPLLPAGATLGGPGSPWVKPVTGHASDPVATATGNYVRQERDLQLAGVGVPFRLVRTYNSLDTLGGPLGRGWTHTLNASLLIGSGGDVTVRTDDGAQLLFTKSVDGTYTGSPGVRVTLSFANGVYELLRHDQIKYRFDSAGKLLSIKDRNLQGLTLAYGGDGRLATVSDSAGRQVVFTHDGSGLLTQVALPDGRSVAYGYTAGRLTSVTDARGKVSSYSYDSRGLLASKVDAASHTVFSNTYGNDGRVTEQIDALGKRSTFAWDPATQTSTMTDARSNAWKQVYANNLLIKEIDPVGNTTEYTYDSNLNRTSAKDARGNTTMFSYDSRGNLLTRTAPAPLSYQEAWTYNALNDALTYRDGRGNTTGYGYDAAGNLTSITRPGGVVTQIGRDPSGRGLITSVTDSRGKTTTFGYDGAGNVTEITTPLGNKTTVAYDGSGRPISRVDPRGNAQGANPNEYKTIQTYDAGDNVLTFADPLGNVTSSAYDNVGLLASITDAKNRITRYAYDAAGNLTTVTAPDNTTTNYAYDDVGNVTRRTDARNNQTTYAYDAANRVTTITNPLAKTWTHSYDANGNLTRLVDAANAATVYAYDALNRLTSIDYGDATPDVSYLYDGNDNRTSMADGAGAQSYSYDALDRLTAVTRGADSFGYAYDNASNLIERIYPGGRISAYTYDDDSRLATVSSNGATTSYSYDAAGNMTRAELPTTNGYTETRTYDRAARLTEVRSARSGSTLSFSAYVRDQVGNPTEIMTTEGVSTYTYDALDRLTAVCYQASCPGGSDPFIRWAYDPVGNRESETRPTGTTAYTFNAADQLTARNGLGGNVTYAYDANGNQTQAGSRTFAYDLGNRLKSTTDAGTTITYAYDGDGVRTQATGSGSTTNYLWDVNNALPQLALERDGSGATLRSYLFGNGRVSMDAGTTSYFHHDGIGSVLNVTSAAGTAHWTYSYEPFGVARTAMRNDPTAQDNPMQFVGEHLDAATGLYHLRARQYAPETGRFLGVDPFPPGLSDAYVSAYVYVSNRPTVLIDPSGKIGCWRLCGVADGVADGVVRAGEFIGDYEIDFGLGVAAAVCVFTTVAAPVCGAVAFAALGASVWRSSVDNGIIGNRQTCAAAFLGDVGTSLTFWGAGKVARRAITPFYMPSRSDRRLAKRLLDPGLFAFEETIRAGVTSAGDGCDDRTTSK